MQLWKPLLLVVPAGLLVGTLAGQATRPVPLVNDERPWPQSVRERADRIEPWRPIHEGGPQDLDPPGYSYRPDLDYDTFAWPDQRDYSAEHLAGSPAHRHPLPMPTLPQTERAEAELLAARAETALPGTNTAPVAAVDPAPPDEREDIVLPPVPPPLARSTVAPATTETVEIDAF